VTRRLAFWSGLAALVAGVATLLWRVGPFPRVRADGPNVIVYLVDTLRADHLGLYGYERDTSPRLDAFARDAIVFDHAYAPSSWTRPSTASLMTGLSPSRHRAIGRLDRVRPELRVLAEHFRTAGYRTLGFVTNPNVLDVWGFDQGFESYRDIDSESLSSRADTVIDQTLRALDALAPEERFFLYVHTLDPHIPYQPPPPYERMFEAPEDESVALYDGEIAFGDEQFGRLLDWLRQRQKYDDTLIVFVSDHGEEFLDHAGTEHGHTLFEEVVRIPLLFKLPDGERSAERVPSIATLMDVLPMILARVGLPVPEGLDGTDLLGAGAAQPSSPGRPLFLDLDLDWHQGRTDIVRGVRVGDLKYLRRLRPVEEQALFDLAADPGEKRDLLPSAPADVARLAHLLDTHITETVTGVHLRASNSEWGETRRCSIALRTTGRFVDLVTRALEDGDRAELDAGGTRIDVVVTLANYPHPTGGIPRVIIDEDSFAFDVEPVDAEIEVESVALDGMSPCPLWLGPTHRRADDERRRFRPSQPDLALVDVAELLRQTGENARALPMGIYLAVVSDAEVGEDVPEDVRERLRQLGYADD